MSGSFFDIFPRSLTLGFRLPRQEIIDIYGTTLRALYDTKFIDIIYGVSDIRLEMKLIACFFVGSCFEMA